MSKEEFKPTDLAVALGEEAPEATKQPQPEPIVEQDAALTVPEAPQDAELSQVDQPPVNDGMMPYGAYASEKAKRQEWEAKYTELEKEQAASKQKFDQLNAQIQAYQYQQQQATKPVDAPDMLVDPDGYTQHVQNQIVQQFNPVLQGLQRQVAVMQHSPEVVGAAEQWMNTMQPHERQALITRCNGSANPFVELVSSHQRDQAASVLVDPAQLEAFKAWQAAQAGQAHQPAPAPVPSPHEQSQPQFVPSLAGKTSMAARSGPTWAGPTPLESVLPE